MFRTAAYLIGSVAIFLMLGCNPSGPSETSGRSKATVTIVPATDTLKAGQTVEFRLSEYWPPGVTPPPTWHYWSVDNSDVASIDASFDVRVTGKSPGRARLTGCLDPELRERCDSRLLTVTP